MKTATCACLPSFAVEGALVVRKRSVCFDSSRWFSKTLGLGYLSQWFSKALGLGYLSQWFSKTLGLLQFVALVFQNARSGSFGALTASSAGTYPGLDICVVEMSMKGSVISYALRDLSGPQRIRVGGLDFVMRLGGWLRIDEGFLSDREMPVVDPVRDN